MGDVTELWPKGGGTNISSPAPIESGHIIESFDCGKAALNDWLRNNTRKAEARSARTYVVCAGNVVIGYYCLATGGVLREEAPAKLRRNMPTSVPVITLGRLAVDAAHQGRGIGSGMLADAIKRTLSVAKEAGVRAMLLHAIDDEAISYYLQYGFVQFPDGDKTLFLPVETMVEAIGRLGR